MTYKQNYYHVLGLESPTWRSSTQTSASQIRHAYHQALLAAHPDKAAAASRREGWKETTQSGTVTATGVGAGAETGKGNAWARKRGTAGYAVDDVREAFAVLGNAEKKDGFDAWLAGRYEDGVLRYGDGALGWRDAFERHDGAAGGNSDFVLGLEVLDLGDFEVVELPRVRVVEDMEGDGVDLDVQVQVQETEWARACRCGAERGFRILEVELEGAVGRGEKEVLVGCEGCSLWVRVGFDVEGEGEGEDEDEAQGQGQGQERG